MRSPVEQRMKPLVKAAAQLRVTGAYLCSHLEIQKVKAKPGAGCCGDAKLDQFVPVCTLIGGACPGLTHCVRLDLQTKSQLVKQWREDLKKKKQVNPLEYVKR